MTKVSVFLRSAALNLALLVGASALALGFGEIVVRVAAPQQLILIRPDIWRPVDSLGWAHAPGLDATVNTGDRTVRMVTDSGGFRVGAFGRPPGRYRVLLLGDSFMAAMQVEYEESLAGLIQRCLAPRAGQTVEVWNTAVSGWDPPQYYLQARRSLSAAPFDLVLVSVFLGNDIVGPDRPLTLPPREPERRRSLRFPRSPAWSELTDALLAPLNDGLETRSHLFVFLKNRFRLILMRLGLTAVEVPEGLRRAEAASPRWEVTGALLARIDSAAAARGAATLFALVPSIEEVDPAVLRDRTRAFRIDSASLDLEQPDRRMAAELRSRRLPFVSLLEPLRAAQGRGVSLYGRADPHPSAEGHRVMWNALAPAIATRLGLPYHADAEEPACGPP